MADPISIASITIAAAALCKSVISKLRLIRERRRTSEREINDLLAETEGLGHVVASIQTVLENPPPRIAALPVERPQIWRALTQPLTRLREFLREFEALLDSSGAGSTTPGRSQQAAQFALHEERIDWCRRHINFHLSCLQAAMSVINIYLMSQTEHADVGQMRDAASNLLSTQASSENLQELQTMARDMLSDASARSTANLLSSRSNGLGSPSEPPATLIHSTANLRDITDWVPDRSHQPRARDRGIFLEALDTFMPPKLYEFWQRVFAAWTVIASSVVLILVGSEIGDFGISVARRYALIVCPPALLFGTSLLLSERFFGCWSRLVWILYEGAGSGIFMYVTLGSVN